MSTPQRQISGRRAPNVISFTPEAREDTEELFANQIRAVALQLHALGEARAAAREAMDAARPPAQILPFERQGM